jgi:hypothetical protein
MLPNTVRRVKSGRLEPAVYMCLTHFMCGLRISLLVCGLVVWYHFQAVYKMLLLCLAHLFCIVDILSLNHTCNSCPASNGVWFSSVPLRMSGFYHRVSYECSTLHVGGL